MVSGTVRIAVAQRILLLEDGRDLSETSLSVVLVVSFAGHYRLVLCRYSQFRLGKYWHRHRRPRPVEYSTDPEFHLRQQSKGGNDEGNSKSAGSKKKKPQPIVDEPKNEEADAVEDVREEEEIAPTTAANVAKLEAQTASALPHPLDDRPLSPVSTASSASEPLAELKMNGGSSGYNSNPSTPAKTTREISERSENGIETPSEIHSASRSVGATVCPFSPAYVYI
jgi:SWI/SNF-related matrix-associated actin-dependent regulator of chromatin subfamily B protein 1